MNNDKVFREVGEALFLAQGLELNIRTIIRLINRQFHAGIDEHVIIYAHDKRTLGQLIHEMKKLGELNQEAADTLREALAARNYVAHHFFTRNSALLRSDSGTVSALKILDAHAQRIAAAAMATSGFVHSFCKTFNVDASSIVVEQDPE